MIFLTSKNSKFCTKCEKCKQNKVQTEVVMTKLLKATTAYSQTPHTSE